MYVIIVINVIVVKYVIVVINVMNESHDIIESSLSILLT